MGFCHSTSSIPCTPGKARARLGGVNCFHDHRINRPAALFNVDMCFLFALLSIWIKRLLSD